MSDQVKVPTQSVICDSCGHRVDLSVALYEELKGEFAEIMEEQLKNKTADLNSEVEGLRHALQKASEDSDGNVAKVASLEAKLKSAESNKEVEFELRLANEKDKLNRELMSHMEGYKKNVDETAELQVREREDTIRQLQEKLSEAQQKAEQGSMQKQGEAQELLIEDFLKEQFPLDHIEEVKKGALGGDTLHTINTRQDLNVGVIYYESKRTKAFSNAWLDKFKQDMIAKGADAGILVSAVRPTGVERATQIKGIWVCTIEEFKILCHAVRAKIIEVHGMKVMEEHRLDNMSLMYDYLTSNEFKMQVETIVEGFSQMQEDLASEKRSMNSIWSKREKQISKVIDNTVSMYGSIKGIGGSAVGDIKSLELK